MNILRFFSYLMAENTDQKLSFTMIALTLNCLSVLSFFDTIFYRL